IGLVAHADTIYYGRDNYNSGGYSHYFKSRDVSAGYPVNTAFVRGLDWYPVSESPDDRINGPRQIAWVQATGSLYMVHRGSTPNYPSGIHKVDPITGATLAHGAVPGDMGLAADDTYVYGLYQYASGSRIYRLNASDMTAAAGNASGTRWIDGGSGTPVFKTGLALSSDGSLLYAPSSTDGRIYQISAADASMSVWDDGAGPSLGDQGDIEIGSDGNMYVLDYSAGKVLRYAGPGEPSEGTYLGEFANVASGWQMAFDATSMYVRGPNGIDRRDLATGAVLETLAAGEAGVTGIAYAIPEPATMALLALGGVLAVSRRRR
ncbi:MAG: PEP-CTERM sorting domain-containing protein, partial [Planctomycetota bacterium]